MKTLAQFINESGNVARAARLLGISRQTIDRWQHGKFKPSPVMVEILKQKGVDIQGQLTLPNLDSL